MIYRTALTLWFLVLAGAGAGCCCSPRVYYGDAECPFDAFAPACYAGGTYGGGCGGGSCGTGGGCGDACGGGCATCCPQFRPFAWLGNGITCRRGCGEIYFGEWISDPPDACDPCDDCGNFIGPRCCPPFLWRVRQALHGGGCRCRSCCGGDWGGGCDSGFCGGGGCASCGGGMHDGGVIHDQGVIHGHGGGNILHENWNLPRSQPVPGQPVHKAETPGRQQMTRRPPVSSQQANYQRPVGTSVRQATPAAATARPQSSVAPTQRTIRR